MKAREGCENILNLTLQQLLKINIYHAEEMQKIKSHPLSSLNEFIGTFFMFHGQHNARHYNAQYKQQSNHFSAN